MQSDVSVRYQQSSNLLESGLNHLLAHWGICDHAHKPFPVSRNYSNNIDGSLLKKLCWVGLAFLPRWWFVRKVDYGLNSPPVENWFCRVSGAPIVSWSKCAVASAWLDVNFSSPEYCCHVCNLFPKGEWSTPYHLADDEWGCRLAMCDCQNGTPGTRSLGLRSRGLPLAARSTLPE